MSTPSGWLVSDSTSAAFIEPSGAVRWTVPEEHVGACALSDTQLAVVTFKALLVVDVADGRVVERHPLKLGKNESFAQPCPVAASASGAVAFASESRLLVVERPTSSVGVSANVAVATRPGPTASEIAKAAKVAKAAADKEAAAASAVVVALEELTSEILATEDVKVLKKARAKLEKLDVLEAGSEPKNEKRIAKCEKALRARMKALPLGSKATYEMGVILDVLTDS